MPKDPGAVLSILVGILLVLFRKRWADHVIRFQQRVWRWKTTEIDVKRARWAAIIGGVLFIVGGILAL